MASACARVPGSVRVSPWSAGWILAATITPVSRSTACSGLYARCVVPSFILQIRASGSVSDRHSAFDSVLSLRVRSKRIRSAVLDAALLGQAAQHLLVILAGIPADQATQRGVRLLSRGVHADPFAAHQIVLVGDFQNE